MCPWPLDGVSKLPLQAIPQYFLASKFLPNHHCQYIFLANCQYDEILLRNFCIIYWGRIVSERVFLFLYSCFFTRNLWKICFLWQLKIVEISCEITVKWYFVTKIVLTYCEKKIVLVIKKNFGNSRLKAENLKFFWDH